MSQKKLNFLDAEKYNASQKHESTLIYMYVQNEFLTAHRFFVQQNIFERL